jgi:hypothetical protein
MSEPVAYAAVAADGSESVYVASLKEQAEACCREKGWFLLPLYAAPPTWQEEVAAVEAAFERSGVQPTWPDDEAGNVGPMAEAMADEIGRLRFAIHSLAEQDATPTTHTTQSEGSVPSGCTLTDDERAAIETAMRCWLIANREVPIAKILSRLLERTK